jgi:4-amino-4-deoxy-L-arabinose transferase-like glycosyltransferase
MARSRPPSALVVLTAAAVALRLWVTWRYNLVHPDTAARLLGDEPGYDYLAWSLFEGRFFDWPGRTPVYPLFLAFSYLLFGHSYAVALYVQAVVGAAAVPLTFVLARRFTGARAALLAAAMIAFHGPLIMYTTRLYTETLYTVLTLCTALALTRAVSKSRARDFVTLGGMLGVLNLCRPTGALLPFFLPLVFPPGVGSWRRISLSAAAAAAMALVVLPWTVHNWRAHEAFIPFAPSVAVLWQGSPEFYHLWKSGRNLISIWERELNSDVNGGHDPFTVEGDRYFTRRALDSIRGEPGVYAKYSAMKAVYLWIGNPVIDWAGGVYGWNATRRWYSLPATVGIFYSRAAFPLLMLLAIARLRNRLTPLRPLLLFPAYFTVVHAITFAEVRYLEGLHPLLAVVIAAAADDAVRRRAASAASGAPVAALAETTS